MVGGMAVQHLRRHGEDDEQDRPAKSTSRPGSQEIRQGQGPRQAAWWALLDVRRATLPDRVLPLGQRWTAVPLHCGMDVVATREFSRTDPSAVPKPSKGKGQGKSEGKGKGEKGGKGKMDQLSGLGEYPCWRKPVGHMPYWDETSHPSESVPLCVAVRNVTEEDEHVRRTVKDSKETRARSETQIVMKVVSLRWRNEIRRARGDDEQCGGLQSPLL